MPGAGSDWLTTGQFNFSFGDAHLLINVIIIDNRAIRWEIP
jgi:hypothetical protein